MSLNLDWLIYINQFMIITQDSNFLKRYAKQGIYLAGEADEKGNYRLEENELRLLSKIEAVKMNMGIKKTVHIMFYDFPHLAAMEFTLFEKTNTLHIHPKMADEADDVQMALLAHEFSHLKHKFWIAAKTYFVFYSPLLAKLGEFFASVSLFTNTADLQHLKLVKQGLPEVKTSHGPICKLLVGWIASIEADVANLRMVAAKYILPLTRFFEDVADNDAVKQTGVEATIKVLRYLVEEDAASANRSYQEQALHEIRRYDPDLHEHEPSVDRIIRVHDKPFTAGEITRAALKPVLQKTIAEENPEWVAKVRQWKKEQAALPDNERPAKR